MAVVKQGAAWVPCVVVKSKGFKTEVKVNGYSFVVFSEHVKVEVPEAVAA